LVARSVDAEVPGSTTEIFSGLRGAAPRPRQIGYAKPIRVIAIEDEQAAIATALTLARLPTSERHGDERGAFVHFSALPWKAN